MLDDEPGSVSLDQIDYAGSVVLFGLFSLFSLDSRHEPNKPNKPKMRFC